MGKEAVMSTCSISDLISAKASEIKAQFQGRELITIQEVCELLGIVRMTAYYLEKSGQFIPRAKLPIRSVCYHVNDVATYLIGLTSSCQTPEITERKQPSSASVAFIKFI